VGDVGVLVYNGCLNFAFNGFGGQSNILVDKEGFNKTKDSKLDTIVFCPLVPCYNLKRGFVESRNHPGIVRGAVVPKEGGRVVGGASAAGNPDSTTLFPLKSQYAVGSESRSPRHFSSGCGAVGVAVVSSFSTGSCG
jgi:hypothetical protein